MIKVGDKFVCIKPRNGYLEPYVIGNIYTIINVTDLTVSFNTEYSAHNDGYVFYTHLDNIHVYLYENMIPLKKYRKQKIEKIIKSI